MDDVELG